jgi:hypothetical protein
MALPGPPTKAPEPVPEQVGADSVRRTPECAWRPDDACVTDALPCGVTGTVPAAWVALEPPSAHPANSAVLRHTDIANNGD